MTGPIKVALAGSGNFVSAIARIVGRNINNNKRFCEKVIYRR
jgi:hypothetical protein